MRLRFWLCLAKSGVVRSEVHVGSVTLTDRMGGGDMQAEILLNLQRPDGHMDWGSAVRLLNDTQGGLFTLAVTTEDQRLLGEWLLTERTRSSDGQTVAVKGVTWDGYPALRAVRQRYKYDSVSQATIALDLLDNAFMYGNPGMDITIPSWSSSVSRSIDIPWGSAYYSDALDEISAPEDGFEWRVNIGGIWDGDHLTAVTRVVEWGAPTLSRASNLVFESGEWGTRHGNARVSGGDSFASWAQTIFAVGAGDGAKQVVATATNPVPGQLQASRRVSYPHVTSQGALTKLAQADLVAAQASDHPYQVEARIDGLRVLPKVGRQARILVGVCPAWPSGLDFTGRVGEVSYRAAGGFVSTVSALVA